MSLTILLGDYGSGKTATAKYLAKQTGGEYIDVDLLSQRNRDVDTIKIIDKLKVIIKPGKDYFMDGYPSGIGHGAITSKEIYTEVKYIACLAAPNIIRQRQMAKAGRTLTALPRERAEIEKVTYFAISVALTYGNNPQFADTTTTPVTLWGKDEWIARWMESDIYATLKDAGAYQDIELSDRVIVGLSKSYKTWDRLSVLVDFNEKSVLDYGCNYGYFCFKAEGVGASSVIGIDESQTVLNMAVSIAITKGSKAKFVCSELKNFPPMDTDIILALNTLHHLDYDKGVLEKMFKCAGMVVFEMPVKDLSKVENIATYHQFGQPVIASSHRQDRCIVIYSKAKPVVLPRRFVYHPRWAAFKKWLDHMVRRYVPKKHFGIARRIKRWLMI